jgi:clathrin heavy chain
VALHLASRGGLSGADDLYVARFNQLFSTGNYTEAAKVAANSPRVSIYVTVNLKNKTNIDQTIVYSVIKTQN